MMTMIKIDNAAKHKLYYAVEWNNYYLVILYIILSTILARHVAPSSTAINATFQSIIHTRVQ